MSQLLGFIFKNLSGVDTRGVVSLGVNVLRGRYLGVTSPRRENSMEELGKSILSRVFHRRLASGGFLTIAYC